MRLFRRLLLVLVALWLIAEIVAIPVVNRIAQIEVADHTHDVTTVHVSVGTFPVLARAFILQKISSVDVTLDRVAGQRIPFTDVKFHVSGVTVDRDSLLKGKLRVGKIDSGTVTAALDLPFGVGSAVHVSGRNLMLGPLAVAIRSDLFPCTPDASVNGSTVTLSCSFTSVPSFLH